MNKSEVLGNYRQYINRANNAIARSIDSVIPFETYKHRTEAIKQYQTVLSNVDITDYLLIDATPVLPRDNYIDGYFVVGTLYKCQADECFMLLDEKKASPLTTEQCFQYMEKAMSCFINILRVTFEHAPSTKQIVAITTQMCHRSQHDVAKCLHYLQTGLLYAPDNPIIHYNLGFIYQRNNKLELSLIHYKLSLSLLQSNIDADIDSNKMIANNYNGIAFIYRSIKQWPEALYYLQKVEKILTTDPDIQNQLGIVYTEMRRTDLAEKSYRNALKHVDKTFISTDAQVLKAEILLNLGHMHSYNGDNMKAVDCYNLSLRESPTFSLPFQNKIMNLSYMFDCLDDKMYITDQHKKVNKLYEKGNGKYKFGSEYFSHDKINIGIVSADFVEHPVSYFISTFLSKFDPNIFNVTCYIGCIIDTRLFNSNVQFKVIKNMSAQQAADLVHRDLVHILFDLSGHTACNRLDVFALKPCPVQVSYIGYPFSTGLDEMDFRITDNICDKLEVSQPYYVEKLVTLPNCFLCYNPIINKHGKGGEIEQTALPALGSQPKLKNKYVTIGCFNRLNKITDSVVSLMNEILLAHSTVRFVFKTKALLNKNIKDAFVTKFDESVRSRVCIWDCTILHNDHLLEYNKIDLAMDTFPYSGTTTSCEALLMGVPVFTLYDSEYYFHAQNVTASILHNSDMPEYIATSKDDMLDKVSTILAKPKAYWSTLKHNVRQKFLQGKVCDQQSYIHDMTTLLTKMYNDAKRT